MIYRTYPHAKAATVFSWTSGILAAVSSGAAILLGLGMLVAKAADKRIDLDILPLKLSLSRKWIKTEILLIIAALLFMLASKYIGRRIAEKTIAKKVRKSVKFAYEYCCENPYYYDYAASLNRDFKYKYARTSYYEIVERKKLKNQDHKR